MIINYFDFIIIKYANFNYFIIIKDRFYFLLPQEDRIIFFSRRFSTNLLVWGLRNLGNYIYTKFVCACMSSLYHQQLYGIHLTEFHAYVFGFVSSKLHGEFKNISLEEGAVIALTYRFQYYNTEKCMKLCI